MRVNEKMRKALSILLCLCMLLQNAPVMAFAAAEDNLCAHHSAHTADCGYVAASAGSDCTHVHDVLCGYVAAVAGADCAHVHDDACGYAPAIEGHECTFACEECKAEEAHTHVYDGEAQYAQKDDSVHTVTRACTGCEEKPTETVDEGHAYTEGFCVCGKAEPVHTHVYVEGICECGAACEHIYAEGVCTVCSMAEPVQEPQVLTITAWSWVDDYEIIDPDYMDAVIPGVGAENPIDWETLVEFLPSYITAQVNGEEVEIPVTWECETFPEAATGGKYTVKAILPAGYVLGEGVTALEVDVDLGTVQQYAITPTQPTNGDGSESSPYQITTAGELYWFAAYVNAGNASACAKLMNDITVNENVLVNGTLNSDTSNLVAWTPIGVRIGSSTKAFRGTFDGDNHTISGLYVSAASGYQGLIGFMESATVKNVTVANSYFSGTTNIGAVVGCYGTEGVSTVTNCHNVGSVVIGSNYYVGGIVGGQYAPATYNAQIVVSDCSNSGSVTGAQHYVGGIIGYAEYFSEGKAISNCTNTGTVTNTSTSRAQGTGGIAGYFGGSSAVKVEIVDCTNSGTIQITEGGKQDYMGGIIGQNSNGHISDCNNRGTISGYQYAGGIVGSSGGTVSKCSNTGSVSGTEAGIGGIAGRNSGTVTTCTNNGSVQGGRHIGGIVGSGAGVSGCTNTGNITSNSYGVGGVIGYIGAAGTVTGCHNEGTVKGTYYIGGLVGHHDTGAVTYTECSNKGAVEGSSQNVGGLFGRIATGSTAKECYNTGNVSCTGTYKKQENYGVGGLAGTTYSAVKFEDCYNTGSVDGGTNTYVGGLVGFFHYGSGSTENYIKRSHNTGSVTGGSYTGGLVGIYKSNGVSEECYNIGSVNGKNYVGGLVGYHNSSGSEKGIIKNCYNTGSVTGSMYVGGLYGNSFYTNTLETSYNIGTVSGSSYVGSVIGNKQTISNCYYLDTSVTNGNTVTGATAMTVEQMTDDANWQTNFAGFDATNVWSKDTNAANMVYFPKLDSYSPALHVHSWTYTASDANSDGVNDTITAGCNAAGCTESNGGSVTIAAPDELVYSGSSMDAVCTYTDWLPDKVDVSYNDIDRVNVTGQNIEASLTYGDVTVSVSYQIAPRVLTDSMLTISNVTYNGNEKTAKVTVKYNSSTTLTAGTHYDVTGTTAATEIGTYTVTVTGKGNYTGTVEKTWTISKGSLSSEIKIESWTYLGDPQEPSVTNNPENGEVTYTYYISSDRRPTMTGTDHGAETAGGVPKYAGTYYVGAIIAETERYKQTTIRPSADTAFVISPREVSNPTFEGLQTSYPDDNGNEIKPTFTLKDNLGNIIPESEYTVAYSNNTAVGTASITVTDNEGGNYTVSGSATFQIVSHVHNWTYTADGDTITATCSGTIGTCPNKTQTIKVVAPTGSMVYDGQERTASIEGTIDGVTAPAITYEGDCKSVGTHTATIKLGEAEAKVEFTITAATPTIAWENETATVTYTGSAAQITDPVVTLVNGEEYNGDISYSYAGTSSGNGLPTNAGTYEITASIPAQGNYTAATSTNKLTLTIEKQKITISGMSWGVPEDAVYNGTEYTATLNGTLPAGVKVTTSGDKATNAGSYTAKAVFSLAEGYSVDNYEIVNGEDLTKAWSIEAKDISDAEISLGTALTYNGEERTQTVSGVKTGELTVTYTVSGNTGTNAGDYTLTVTGNGNFKGTATKAWNIAKKNISGANITLGDDLTYNGKAQTKAIAKVEIDGLTVTFDVSGNEQTNAGDYTLTVAGSGNFEGEATADWSIAKAALTVTAKDNSITYGDAPANDGVIYAGFVNGETVAVLGGELAYSYNYEQFGKVGTYKITPSGLTSGNYEITFVPGKLTVVPKAITVKANAVSKTYGEAEPTLTYRAEGLVNNDKLTGALTRNEGENVGAYAIEQGTLTAGNNYTITYTGAELTINAKAITKADVALDGSLAYTGEEQTQPITVTEGITYTVTGDKATDVGTYELTVKGTDNYTGEVKLSWSIRAAVAVVGTAPTAKELTYTGEEQALVNAGTTADGKLVYSLSENGEFTETIPTGNNASDYMVWYYVQGDDNHADSAKASVKVTIAKAKAEISVATTPITVTYGETVELPTATSNFGTVSCDKTAAELVNAGTYTVTYTVEGTDNYEGDSKTVTVTVEKLAVAEPTVTSTHTYTKSEQTAQLADVESYMTIASGNKATNAGSYEVVITLDGNHKWADGSDGKVQWSIGKAQAQISVNTDPITVTYGETVTLPTATTNFGAVVCDKTAADLVNAGTYTVTYTVAGTDNYDGDTKSITVIVNAKAITVTAEAKSKTYGDADPKLTYTVVGLENNDTLTGELKRAAGENVGSYAIGQGTLTAGSNYIVNYNDAAMTITAKAITEADVQLSGSLAYTGAEQTQPITVTAGITYTVTGDKATDVGTYELTVKGTDNYTGEVKLSWSIKAAVAVVGAAPTAKTLTYTGEAQALVNAGTTADGKLVYSLSENGEFTETIPVGLGAGEYTVWYYVKGDENHSDSDVKSVEVTVAKAKAVITVDTDPVTVTYGETATLPTATTNFGTVSRDKTAAELVNAGTYTVTYTVEGTANYEGDTKTLTVIVEKKAVPEPAVTGTYTYTGEEQTAQLTGVESCMTVASGDKATNAGSYEAVITLDGNHKWADGSDGKVQWSIGKAEFGDVYVSQSGMLTYNGTAQTPKVNTDADSEGDQTATFTYSLTENGPYGEMPGFTDAGTYTVYFRASAPNHKDAAGSFTVTINPKAITEADVSLNGSLVYTGSELTQAVTVTAGITCEISGNKATDVGTYELTVKATGNYTGEVSLTWSIKAAAATVVTAPRANTLTYTGEAQALVTAGTAKGGTVQYQLNGGAWSETIPTAKDEGTYTVSYKVAGDANHADTEPVALTVTIGDCTHAGNTNREDNDCTTEVTCSVCGDVLTEAKSHVWGDWVVTLDPTTTAEGAKERSCTNSGCKAKDTESIPMLNEVAVPEVSGGDVTVDNDTPATGDDVTVTVTPETGREVESITVTDKDGNEIEVTENEDGTYTYEQPQGDVTIEVTLKDTIYTVKWMVDGAVYKTAQYKYGETITAPAAPGKAQSGCTTYTFEKWDGFTACMTMPDDAELTFTAVFAQGESHVDEDTDHICDRECGKQGMGDHVDGDLDHACDYGCEEPIGEHKDADTDHVCDYGCKVAIGTCEDTDKDHACDYGCGKVYGEHSDSDNDQDHKCDYCGEPMPKDGIQVEIPTDDTGTIIPGAPAEIDGKPIVIDWDGEIWLEDKNSKILVTYKFNEDEDPHKEYPTAMYAWYLKWTGDTCEAIRVPELDNFMTYKGTSIRVGHSSDGIRFFTAVPVDALNKVMAGTLLTGELEGYKLVEMGTLYKWAATGTELTIENGAKSYVYGGSAGSTYRQFSKEGDLSWFTGMLTNLPGDAQTLAKDILSRPYAVFQKGNDTIVLYGGSIQRSIYYVALQNKDTWATGTAYDNYVEKIISTVDAANG